MFVLLKLSLPVRSYSRHYHSGFHYFLTVFAFLNTLGGFAMLLAALASSAATMLLAPVFVSQPQALKLCQAETMLVFIYLLCCPV